MPDGIEGGTEGSVETDAAPPVDAGTSDAGGSIESTPTSAEALDFDSYADHVVTVKVDGEEVSVPLKEALSGYQRQADYTRKTQELAERQRQAEAYEQLDAAFRADPEGTLKALARQAGVEFGATDESGITEEVDPEEARIRKIEDFMRSEEERRQREHLDSTLVGLKDKFGPDNVDEAALIKYAVDRGYTVETLEDAFKAMHYDKAIEEARATAQAEKEQGESDREDAKGNLPPVHGGASNGGPVTSGGKPVTSIREAFALAKEQLGR